MRVLPYRTANNRVEGAILTFTDIDELQKNQDRLEAIELAIKEIAQVSSEALILLNEEQKLVAISQGCERLIPSFANRDVSEWGEILLEQLGTLLRTQEAFSDQVLEINLEEDQRDRVTVERTVIGRNTAKSEDQELQNHCSATILVAE